MNKMNYFSFTVGIILMMLFFVQHGWPQTSDELKNLSKELEELKQNQKAIQRDLQEIKNVLRARGLLDEVPSNLFIDISGRPFKGDKKAKLTLIEFSEYQ